MQSVRTAHSLLEKLCLKAAVCQHAAEVSTGTQQVDITGISEQWTGGGNVGGRQATDWHKGRCSECVTSLAQCMQAQCC